MSPGLPPRLLALSPGDLVLGEGLVARKADLLERVRAAWRGGLRGVLLREPQLPDGVLWELAVDLGAILDGGWLGLSVLRDGDGDTTYKSAFSRKPNICFRHSVPEVGVISKIGLWKDMLP